MKFKPGGTLFFTFVMFLAVCQTLTAGSPDYAPYPGGSPFPPGKEPSITHSADVFWTTTGVVDRTDVKVLASGSRPTQVDGVTWIIKDGRLIKSHVPGGLIGPECKYHFVFVRNDKVKPPKYGRLHRVEGVGTIQVRVYGFNRADFEIPPRVTATYYYKGKVVGKTVTTTHPMPKKLKTGTSPAENNGGKLK